MAEKRVIELEINTNEKSLKAQLRQAQAEVAAISEKFGVASKEAAAAASKAAELKDRIADAKNLTDAFNPDAKFNALSSSIGGVLNGFQAFEGALGLVGVEGKAVQETLLKVQSAMAVSQGLQGLMEAKDSFKQLGAVAKNALSGIKTGLAATGIGIFLVALGTIVAYWDDIKAAVSGVSAEQEKLNALSHEKFETSKQELQNLDAQDNILKLQGKSERDILNIKIKKIDAAIALGKIELNNVLKTSEAEEKAAIQNYNLTKKIVDFILDTALFLPKLMLMPIDMAIKGANKVSEALGFGKVIAFDMGKTIEDMQNKFSGFIAGSLFNVEDLKKENAQTRKELENQITELENQKAGFILNIKELDKKDREEKIAKEKEITDKLKEEHEKRYSDIQSLQAKSFKDIMANKLNNDLNELASQKEIDEMKLDAYTQYLEKVKQKDEEEKERKRKVAFAIAQTTADALNLVATIAEKNAGNDLKRQKNAFNIRKAANIAQATIDGTKAVLSTYADTPGGPILKGVAAAISGAFAALQISAIAKSKFESPETNMNTNIPSSNGGMTAPSFNVIGNSGINQLATLQQQPTKAYVVSGEIASGLALERNRLQNSHI